MNNNRKKWQNQNRQMSNKIKPDGTTKKQGSKKNSARETTEAVLIALVAALLLRAFVVQAFTIPTGSMKDTLLIGDFLLVNKFIYGVRTPDSIPLIEARLPIIRLPAFKTPQRGDVVVFKYPPHPKEDDEILDYIKRCIAIGGDTVTVVGGEVFINGKPEGEQEDLGQRIDPEDGRYVRRTRIKTPGGKTYVVRHYFEKGYSSENRQWVVPEGHYFMMGDNRDNSSDSRVWGFLPHENVVGEALIIYFSRNKLADWWDLVEGVRWSRITSLIR